MILNKIEKQGTILYIDDEYENLIGFKASFSHCFNVLTATTTTKAIDLLQKNEVQVLLVDYKMPNKDGIAFALSQKNNFPNIECILISAYADTEMAIAAINTHAFYAFVHKPWEHDKLNYLIRNAIDKYHLKKERDALIHKLQKAYEREKNANKAKDIFLKNISHEIRTPLNAILGFSSLLKKEVDNPTHQDSLQIIVNSGNQLLDVVNQLLESSIILTNQLVYNKSPFDLRYTIEEIISNKCKRYNKTPSHIKTTKFKSTKLLINNDKHKISRILENLIDNAIKFSPADAPIIIENITTPDTNKLEISITNQLATQIQLNASKIFAPFRQFNESNTRDTNGNGLGLYIAKAYTEYIGGELTFSQAKPGEISFILKLTQE